MALQTRGHVIRVLPDYSWFIGGEQGVIHNPATGTLAGGADSRRDGYAIAD
jgi:gamma-glutamyltranspeptidase